MQSQNSNEKLFVRCGGYRSGLLLAVLLALAPAFSSPQAMAGDGDGDGEVWCGFDELGVEIPCGQPGGKSSANRLRDLGAMAGHLVTSHTGSLLFRPIYRNKRLRILPILPGKANSTGITWHNDVSSFLTTTILR